MLDINEINKTISELENQKTSFAVCEKLAWLYIIKDHYTDMPYSSTININGDSEFLQTVKDVPSEKLFPILDEHMEVVKLLYPKEYTALIAKIKALS